MYEQSVSHELSAFLLHSITTKARHTLPEKNQTFNSCFSTILSVSVSSAYSPLQRHPRSRVDGYKRTSNTELPVTVVTIIVNNGSCSQHFGYVPRFQVAARRSSMLPCARLSERCLLCDSVSRRRKVLCADSSFDTKEAVPDQVTHIRRKNREGNRIN